MNARSLRLSLSYQARNNQADEMDQKAISVMLRQIETKVQLLNLLNRIKRLTEVAGMADRFHPFTMRQLNFYCNPNHPYRYKQFKVKKKSGGVRQIATPSYFSFKVMLRCVNELFKAVYTPSAYAMGFAEGRSVVSNAIIHKGQHYVFNIDLKDFFPSVDQARVWKRLQLAPLCCKPSIANVLAGLCAMRQDEADGTVRYVLPQGAPTSPIVTNMICDTLDRRLAGLAKRFGLHYSRYADDITFRSMHNVYQEAGDFRKELKRIIEGQGFRMNDAKTRLQKLGSRQEVTGVVVGQKLNVPQQYVRDLRNILYIWDRYGYATAFSKFFPKYQSEKGHVKKKRSDMVKVLSGKLMYLKMVKGDKDSVYLRLKAKFDQLVERFHDAEHATRRGVTCVETLPVLEFEKRNGTEIIITMTKPVFDPSWIIASWKAGKLYGGVGLDRVFSAGDEASGEGHEAEIVDKGTGHGAGVVDKETGVAVAADKEKEDGRLGADDEALDVVAGELSPDELAEASEALRHDDRVLALMNALSNVEKGLGSDGNISIDVSVNSNDGDLDALSETEDWMELDDGTLVPAIIYYEVEAEKARCLPHRYAYFMLGGKHQNASVNTTITEEEEKQKELLSISHCRDAKGKLFWLIHRSDKVIGSYTRSEEDNVLDVLELDAEELEAAFETGVGGGKAVAETVDVDALNEVLDDLLQGGR